MCSLCQFIVFSIYEQKCSMDSSIFEGAILVVKIFPVPKAPDFFLSMINLQGQYIPALDTLKLLNLPPKDTSSIEQLIIAQMPFLAVALLTDEVMGVMEWREETDTDPGDILPGLEYINGGYREAYNRESKNIQRQANRVTAARVGDGNNRTGTIPGGNGMRRN